MIAICLIAIVWIELADDDGDDLRKRGIETEHGWHEKDGTKY